MTASGSGVVQIVQKLGQGLRKESNVERPEQCGKCGSTNIHEERVTVNAEFAGHYDENFQPAEPDFAPPLPISFEVAEWHCQDCEAILLDRDAIKKRIGAQIIKAISELN
jgi:hypothetical protein